MPTDAPPRLPPLPAWKRWLAEVPSAFTAGPAPGGPVDVAAVVSDLHEALYGARPPADLVAALAPEADRVPWLRWVLLGAHLAWHPHVRASPPPPEALRRFLLQDLAALAAVARPEKLLAEEDRREELVRLLLRAAAWTLPGESTAEAEDRLQQVDSVVRHRVLAEATLREKRAREVREAMARRAAEEAAARVNRE